jgi:hypothetical protein
VVPEKETMEYTLQCGKGAVQKLSIPWSVKPIASLFKFKSFNDTQSYWNSQCLAPTRSNAPAGNRRPNEQENLAPAEIFARERGTIKLPKGPRDGTGKGGPITKAKQILTTSTTAFYTINNSDACVAVIATESVANKSEYNLFIKGFKALRDAGCKKLIFDMTGNGGGSIDFATFINALIFPDTKPYFSQDLRAGAYVQGAAKIAAKTPVAGSSIFDGRGFFNSKTGKPFADDSMFTRGKKYTRGGKTDTYSQRNFFGEGWAQLPLPKNDTLPWKAKDMAILTNGYW